MKYESIAIRVSGVLDKYLPADGIGTAREKLRMDLHREFSMLIQIEEKKLTDAMVEIGKSIFNSPTL